MSEDPFDILGLPARFDLERGRIERAWLARSAAAHPDLAAGEVEEATSASSRLNQARRTLEDPERRADALLVRLGGPSPQEEKSLPDGFLFEIMETREQIEAAIEAGGEAERERWRQWAQQQRRDYTERIGQMFERVGEASDAERLRAIRVELNAWRYIERLIEQLDPAYDPQRADFA